jgi:hypothetical protein
MMREARYTSPSGKKIVFARETELKTGVFTFPGKDGANVQHQGAGAKTFPLACIFSGAGYTTKAGEFEAMLIERGIAELQHPVYGTTKNPGASSRVLRWIGNLLYWPGPYPKPKTLKCNFWAEQVCAHTGLLCAVFLFHFILYFVIRFF